MLKEIPWTHGAIKSWSVVLWLHPILAINEETATAFNLFLFYP